MSFFLSVSLAMCMCECVYVYVYGVGMYDVYVRKRNNKLRLLVSGDHRINNNNNIFPFTVVRGQYCPICPCRQFK